ncbi:hypothetical protein PIB30_089661 [Stylosanthes scabra]|uniref:Reverse transcriptase domain-containing protein n=1 Tax=Stylosanthes scabra TaxID=79078 RepID=A0ABU6TTJ2_9FABA|nr:hypothetical protein [Stylosanthes scabra]
MVPLELAEETGRVSGYSPEENNLHREDNVDLIYEVREEARMRQANIGRKNAAQGKLGANWESPYQVVKVLGKGAYKLRTVDGAEVPRTWHITNLKSLKKRTKSPGAITKALKLTQRATYKVVGTNTTAPHRTDHPCTTSKSERHHQLPEHKLAQVIKVPSTKNTDKCRNKTVSSKALKKSEASKQSKSFFLKATQGMAETPIFIQSKRPKGAMSEKATKSITKKKEKYSLQISSGAFPTGTSQRVPLLLLLLRHNLRESLCNFSTITKTFPGDMNPLTFRILASLQGDSGKVYTRTEMGNLIKDYLQRLLTHLLSLGAKTLPLGAPAVSLLPRLLQLGLSSLERHNKRPHTAFSS